MADTDAPVAPETTPTEPLAPVGSAVTPPEDNGSSNSDVEALKAQLQKLEMERNLLRKKVDSTSKELEQKTNKELEEKEDFRSLAERLSAKVDELSKEKEVSETKQAVEAATSAVFGEFDPKVVEVAKTAGLYVSDASDEAKEAFKAKLTEIQSKIGISAPKVNGSNPAPPAPANPENEAVYAPRVKQIGTDIVANRSAVAKNTITARNQLGHLQSLDAMREMAGVVRQEV